MRKSFLALLALSLAACSGQSYTQTAVPIASSPQGKTVVSKSHSHRQATINNVYVLEPRELLRFPAGEDTSTPNETKQLDYTAGINVPTGYGPVYGNALAVSPANGNVAVIHADADKVSVYGRNLDSTLYTITMPHSGDTYAISIAVTYDRYGTLYVAETWCNTPSCYYYSGHNAVYEFYGDDTTPDSTWVNLQGWGLTTIAAVSNANSGLYVNECAGCMAYSFGIVKDCSNGSGLSCTSTGITPRDSYDSELGRSASQIALEDASTMAVQYCTNYNTPCQGSHNKIQEYSDKSGGTVWTLSDTFSLCDAYSDLNVPSLTADVNGTLYYPCTPQNYPSNSESGSVIERVSSSSKFTISSLTPPVIGAAAY